MTSTREFFETLETRVDESKTAGMNNSYLFDIEGAGKWKVDVADGKVTVSEGDADADATISASEETFTKMVSGEQNPTSAYYGDDSGVSIFIASSTTSGWRGCTLSPGETKTLITVPGIGAVTLLCSAPAPSCDAAAASASGAGAGARGARFS